MIISVHIPKTAGSSFSAEITDGKFGRYLLDYDDMIFSKYSHQLLKRVFRRVLLYVRRKHIESCFDIIHGHFIADKYIDLFESEKMIAFFRDPVALTISLYDYWTRGPKIKFSKSSWYMETIAQGMDIVEFAHTTEMMTYYTTLLGGVSLNRFFFIGLTEEYSNSLKILGNMLKVPLSEKKVNVGNPLQRTSLTKSAYQAITTANIENYEIYRQAVDVYQRFRRDKGV